MPCSIHFLSLRLNFPGLIHFPCQVQEAAVYDPFLLFSANLKRDLAEEQPYRRALRELGLSCSSVWRPGRREAKALHLGYRLAGYLSGGRLGPLGRSIHEPYSKQCSLSWELQAGARCGAGEWGVLEAASRGSWGPRAPCSLPGCLDMLSLPGQFTFTADRPQLHCAIFFIGEPEEFITIHYDLVSIDCQGGDFLKVRGSLLLTAPAHVPLGAAMWGTTESQKRLGRAQEAGFLGRV